MLRAAKLAVLLMIAAAVVAPSASAGVLLKPKGGGSMPLWTRSMKADATVAGQFAFAALSLTFQNESSEQMEAEFIYELPPGAVATYFAYWAGEEKVVARIVEKAQAKRIYEKIVQTWRRDPALVEMAGKNTFRARIFPVMPNADLRVEIHIVQVLRSDGGAATYSLPIHDKSALDPLDSIDVKIRVKPDPSIAKVSTNYGIPVRRDASGYEIDLCGEEYRPPKDLNVRIDRKPAKMQASLYAARSGGAAGFFALALMPDHSLTDATVTIEGVKTREVTRTRFARTKAFGPITVCGRYTSGGKAVVTLRGRSPSGYVTYRAPVTFGSAAEPDNPASKLWAAARIQQLGTVRRNRAAVIEISKRYGMPSKYTSWLAVPKEEMKEYRRQQNAEKMNAIRVPLEKAIRENKPDSVVMPLVRRFNDLCKSIGLDPKEELSYLQWDMAARLAEIVAAGKEDSAEYRLIGRRMTSVFGVELDWKSGSLRDSAGRAMEELASFVAREQDRDTPDVVRIDALRTRISRLGELSGIDPSKALRDAGERYESYRAWELIDATVKGIRSGQPVQLSQTDLLRMQSRQAELARRVESEAGYTAHQVANAQVRGGASTAKIADMRAQLDRLCAYSGLDAADLLHNAYVYEMRQASMELVWQTSAAKPNAKSVAEIKARLARLEKLTGQPSAQFVKEAQTRVASERASSSAWALENKLFDAVAAGNYSEKQLGALRSRYDAACKLAGLNPQEEFAKRASYTIADLALELLNANAQARPDVKEIARLRASLDRVERYAGISMQEAMKQSHPESLWYALEPIVGQLNAELSRETANKSRLVRLKARYDQLNTLPEVAAFKTWSKNRDAMSRYGALLDEAVELKLESMALARQAKSARSIGDDAKAAELDKKNEEINAKLNSRLKDMRYSARLGGDPLISVNAPADALRVIALMPDGEIKTLEYIAERGRWEARFDIPTYMLEGQYLISVTVVLKDGTTKQMTLPYNVDLTPPKGTAGAAFVEWSNRLRLDVAASEDTARVTALMPWGKRVDMRAAAEHGRFYAVVEVPDDYAAGGFAVAFVLLDNAHNRSEITAYVRAQ